jgi:protein tyrosine/serine phosphatase
MNPKRPKGPQLSWDVLCMNNMKLFAVIIITALVLLNVSYGAETSPANRPAHWAKPIQVKGAPNLHKVSETLYRSAQPSAEGMANLKAMGIETIVNLRSFHSDRDEIGNTGLAYEHIYMKAWHPEEEDAVRFLQIVTNPKRTPVLVHCQHGADRTGIMFALYRVAVQGWTKEEAIREMTQGGFGFHEIWKNLPDWFENLDIETIKKKAGIKSGTEQTNSPDKK